MRTYHFHGSQAQRSREGELLDTALRGTRTLPAQQTRNNQSFLCSFWKQIGLEFPKRNTQIKHIVSFLLFLSFVIVSFLRKVWPDFLQQKERTHISVNFLFGKVLFTFSELCPLELCASRLLSLGRK